MDRIFPLYAAMVSGLALYLVAYFGGFAFLGSSLADILEYIGVIVVLVFGLILIFFGVKTLLGNRLCNNQCNNSNNKPF